MFWTPWAPLHYPSLQPQDQMQHTQVCDSRMKQPWFTLREQATPSKVMSGRPFYPISKLDLQSGYLHYSEITFEVPHKHIHCWAWGLKKRKLQSERVMFLRSMNGWPWCHRGYMRSPCGLGLTGGMCRITCFVAWAWWKVHFHPTKVRSPAGGYADVCWSKMKLKNSASVVPPISVMQHRPLD